MLNKQKILSFLSFDVAKPKKRRKIGWVKSPEPPALLMNGDFILSLDFAIHLFI